MATSYPADRIDWAQSGMKQMAAMLRLERSVELEETLANLIKLRASQINGCAFCIDMHWKDARAAGESEERLYMLEAWRESSLYDERERAALELCEAITLVSETHVPDDVWERASEALGEEAPQAVFAAAAINTWNRLMITARAEPGHYRAGELAAA
jgi:AhpD family alkylhydroperoxidase